MNGKSDLESFNLLFAEYRKPFTRFAFSYIRDITVAEDFTVDAFMGYWENRHKLSENTNPPAYILTILKNKCLNYLQHLQVRDEAIEKLKNLAERELNVRIATLKACDPDELFSSEVQEIIKQTLLKLPEKTRRIFQMSREQNLSYSEISEQTGLTTKSVEFHVSKAIKAFRVSLKEYLPAFFFFLF